MLLQTIAASNRHIKKWNASRRENWLYFARRLSARGFAPYWTLDSDIVPGVYLTKVPKGFAGEEVKRRLNLRGVEATQYYHQNGFYFPVHQFLSGYEKQYILYHFQGLNP